MKKSETAREPSVSNVSRGARKYHELRSLLRVEEKLNKSKPMTDSKIAAVTEEILRCIGDISTLRGESLEDIAAKIEVWVAEIDTIDGIWQTMRHEDQLIFSALRDLMALLESEPGAGIAA